MSTTIQPVSGNTSAVSYSTPAKKESQFFITWNELAYRVQEGDTPEKIAGKIEHFLLSLSGKKDFWRVAHDSTIKKTDLLKVLKDYNDFDETLHLKKGDLIYIPLIREQIDFERLMDHHHPKAIPGIQLEVAQEAPRILKELNKIMPSVRQTIEEIAREQEIKELKEEIIDFIRSSTFDMSEAEVQGKIRRDINRMGELKAEETFSFLVGLFESDSKRINQEIRWAIINTFGSIGSDICVQYLTYLFESKEKNIDSSILLSTISALGRSGNPLALNFLKRMATGEYKIYGYLTWGQDSAIDALGEFYQRTKNPEAIKILHQLLTHNNHEVRYWTVNVLGKVGGQKEKDLLLKTIIQSKTELGHVKNSAREAIQKIEERL